jgi:hypothetical protein
MFYTRIFTIFYVNFLQTLRIIVKQDCIFTNKKIVSASANCSQQHDVVLTAHATKSPRILEISSYFTRVFLSSRHHEEDPGDEVVEFTAPRQYYHTLNMKYSEMTSTECRLALKCCHDNTIFLNFIFIYFVQNCKIVERFVLLTIQQ